jgi:uncharacterized protein YciI/uncharacterized protein YndB with AHSA1/START domain
VNTVPPIRREILVEADPAVAFEVFTSGLGRWWPVAELSVHGEGGSVSFHGAFAGGQIVERSAAGETAVWGTVTRWEPPDAVAFTWHPGQPAERASQVEITFAVAEPAEDGTARTLVAVVHAGWEAFADPAAARAEYDHGWPLVLDRYAGHIAGRGADAGSDGEETWVALLHRPGPEAPRDGSVFTDPRFGEHVAFLARMHAAGYLVAAGPLADAEGEGMTILRLPGPGQLGTATRLATEDDISVASGFFSVTVRPWQVVMSGA